MAAEKSPLPAIKPVDATIQSSEQVPASTNTGAPKKTAKKVPEGYKLVKVPQPDGTFKTVLRPIAKDAVTGASSISKPPTKVVQKAANTQAAAISTEKSSSAAQVGATIKKTEATPQKTGALATETSSALPSETTSEKRETLPKKTNAPPAHTSKLDAVSKSSRIFQKLHRVRGHASKLIAALEPDLGEDDCGDITVSDDSYDGDSDGDSDDSDTNQNEENNKSSSGIRTQGNTASNVRSPTSTRTAPAANSKKPEVLVIEKANNKSSTDLSKDALVLEKETMPVKWQDDCNTTQKGGMKSLANRSADWTTYIVWGLMILLPIAFIGITSSHLVKRVTNLQSRPRDCHFYLG
jgi:hypothetical protein